MMEKLFIYIYATDIPVTISAMIGLLILWAVIGVLFSEKMKYIGMVVCILSFITILYVTIFSRNESSYGYELIPFSSIYRAVENKELYRSMLMNALLFLPLGLGLPYALSGETKKRIMMTLIIGCVLSIIVESLQGLFLLGLMETDDVICNTLGALMGSCAYLLSFFILKQKAKKRGKSCE